MGCGTSRQPTAVYAGRAEKQDEKEQHAEIRPEPTTIAPIQSTKAPLDETPLPENQDTGTNNTQVALVDDPTTTDTTTANHTTPRKGPSFASVTSIRKYHGEEDAESTSDFDDAEARISIVDSIENKSIAKKKSKGRVLLSKYSSEMADNEAFDEIIDDCDDLSSSNSDSSFDESDDQVEDWCQQTEEKNVETKKPSQSKVLEHAPAIVPATPPQTETCTARYRSTPVTPIITSPEQSPTKSRIASSVAPNRPVPSPASRSLRSPMNAPLAGRVAGAQPAQIRETDVVKKKKAMLPKGQLPHPTPKFGDWLNSRRMINNYIILESLGSGSYAEVKLCKQKVTDLLFAMKFINRDIMKQGNLSKQNPLEDIKREIAIMKKLNHPNVLRLYEVMDDPNVNKLYLVLEFMKQGDLLTRQKNRSKDGTCQPMDDKELHCVLLQVLLGLAYLHDQKIVHGDLKPQNLLLDDRGMVKIADFGISQSLYGSKQQLADTVGTPAFMSPEMCSGEAYSGQLADIWALGATIYMLKFGRPPFIANNAMEIFERIQHDPLQFPHEIDASLKELLIGILTKDPDSRMTLLQVMTHPWVTKEQVKSAEEPKHSKQITVSSDEISNAICGADGFALIVNVRGQMVNRLQTARKQIVAQRAFAGAVVSPTHSSPNIKSTLENDGSNPERIIQSQAVVVMTESTPPNEEMVHMELSQAESNYRTSRFANKRSKPALFNEASVDNGATTTDSDDYSSSSDEEQVDVMKAQSSRALDALLMTALAAPGFEHSNVNAQPVLVDSNDLEMKQNEHLDICLGMTSMQGRRSTQEDRCMVMPSLDSTAATDEGDICYAAVFDGHGGSRCVDIVNENFHKHLYASPAFPTALDEALSTACESLDKEVISLLETDSDASGSTAAIVLLHKPIGSILGELVIANVGDCRIVLGSRSEDNTLRKVHALTRDHKATDPEEAKQIVERGGTIVNDRVNGVLAVTRSFGDIEFKGIKEKVLPTSSYSFVPKTDEVGHLVVATPEITKYEIQDQDELLIIACDGVWDVLSNEDALNYTADRLALHHNVQLAATELVQEAIHKGTTDNVTAIVVAFSRAAGSGNVSSICETIAE